MQYSPKLKVAMEEIKAILTKHDIAAGVVLHTPGHSEFLLHLTPTYSCVKPEMKGYRFRAKKEDFGGDAKARNEALANTSNMLMHLATISGKHLFSPTAELSQAVDQILDAKHGPGSASSHESQNN